MSGGVDRARGAGLSAVPGAEPLPWTRLSIWNSPKPSPTAHGLLIQSSGKALLKGM